MIQLKVEDYCNDSLCTDFEAEVSRSLIYADNDLASCNTVVTCVNANKCASLYNRLRFVDKAKG